MPSHILVAEVPAAYRCTLCNEPWEVETAVTCPGCEEIYDRDCLADFALKEKTCKGAGCTVPLADLSKFAPVHRSLRGLADTAVVVRCRFHLRGCAWQGKRSEFGAHMAACPRTPPAIVYDGEVPADLLCTICHDAFTEPRSLKTCEHIFCAACIEKAVAGAPRCPNCTVACTAADIGKAPRQLATEADRLPVKCAMHDGGCAWKGTRRDYAGHSATCKFLLGTAQQPQGAATTKTAGPAQQEPAVALNTDIPHIVAQTVSEQPVVAMMTVTAPELVKLEDRKDPLCISAVIDVSGSMEGPRLELAKQTLEFVIGELSDRDELGIVAFDTNVTVRLPVTKMNDAGKHLAIAAARALCAGSSTNLSGGLLAGIEQALEVSGAKQKKPSFFDSIFSSNNATATAAPVNKARAVLLLTDGEANAGITGTPELIAAVEQSMLHRHVTVYTFGFGEGHNANLLRAIGEATQGSYYYIQNTDVMKEVFADCLGGLVSIVMQKIEVEVAAAAPFTRIKRVMTKYPTRTLPSGAHVITIADMYSQESRDILAEVVAAGTGSLAPGVPLLTWTLRYDNSITGKSGNTRTLTTSVALADAAYTGAPNLKVDEQMARIRVTDALEAARKAANEHRMEDAKREVARVKVSLANCASKSTAQTMMLAKEVDDCDEFLESEVAYAQEGSKKMNQMAQRHGHQRCNRAEETDAYTTGWKCEMQRRAKK